MSKADGGAGRITAAFERRRDRLWSVARRAGPQEVEDVLQDAFLRAIERSQEGPVEKVDNLLSRIVRCFAIDRIRRRAVRSGAVWTDVEEHAVDAAADPERALMGTQRLRRVLSVIDAMPPRRREVFLLHRVEELTYAQIARQLGVSVKAVEKHMHLAMRQLSDADD